LTGPPAGFIVHDAAARAATDHPTCPRLFRVNAMKESKRPAPARRRSRLFLSLLPPLLLFACWPSAEARAQGPDKAQTKSLPEKSKRYALVIGVDKYADTQISTLGGASNDARLLKDALVAHAGFPESQVILLTSSEPPERQPTRGNILRRLSNLASDNLARDGLILFFFAGHGMERGGQAFLLPSDAQVSDDVSLLEQTAVNVTQVRDWLKKSKARQVLTILDACRNDPAGRANADNPLTATYTKAFDFDRRNREIEAYATLYATEVGKRAYEFKEKRHGYFTWALVEGLKGEAANERGEVTLSRLVAYLQERVPKQVKLDLGAGKAQRPFAVVEGYKADELVLGVGGGRGLTVANQVKEEIKEPEPEREQPDDDDSTGDKGRAAPIIIKLEGTTWEGFGSSGLFTIEFLPEGKLRYTLDSNKMPIGGKWKQTRDFLSVDIGGVSVFNGRIKGHTVEGELIGYDGTRSNLAFSLKEQ
jgi:hypothetical protein